MCVISPFSMEEVLLVHLSGTVLIDLTVSVFPNLTGKKS